MATDIRAQRLGIICRTLSSESSSLETTVTHDDTRAGGGITAVDPDARCAPLEDIVPVLMTMPDEGKEESGVSILTTPVVAAGRGAVVDGDDICVQAVKMSISPAIPTTVV